MGILIFTINHHSKHPENKRWDVNDATGAQADFCKEISLHLDDARKNDVTIHGEIEMERIWLQRRWQELNLRWRCVECPSRLLQIHGPTKIMAVCARFLAESSSYVRVQECNKKGVGPLFMDVFGRYEQKTFGSAVDITTEIWFLNSRRATTHFSNLPSILKFHYKTCIDRLYVIGPTPLPSHDAAWTPSTCSSC